MMKQILKLLIATPLALFISMFLSVSHASSTFDLSLSSAILFALNNNPDVGIAKQREVQTFYSIEEVRSALYPQVNMGAAIGMQYNDPSSGTSPLTSDTRTNSEVSLLMRQIVFDGFGTLEAVKERETRYRSSQYATKLERQEVMVQVVENYLSVLAAQKNLRLQENFIAELEELVGQIRLQFEAGAASKAKLDYANSRLAFAKTNLTNARSSLNDTISNLEALTGKLPNFQALEPSFLYAQKASLDDYITYLFQNNLDFKINRTDKKALEHAYYVEAAERMPSVTFQVEAAQKHDDGGISGMTREAAAFFQMNYTIFDGYAVEASQNKIMAQMKELDYNGIKLARELRRDVKLLYNQLTATEENSLINAEEIQANEDLQNLNRENFESGSIDVIELIEGEERLVASKIRKHTLVSDLYQNTYELLLLIGSLDKNYFCKSC